MRSLLLIALFLAGCASSRPQPQELSFYYGSTGFCPDSSPAPPGKPTPTEAVYMERLRQEVCKLQRLKEEAAKPSESALCRAAGKTTPFDCLSFLAGDIHQHQPLSSTGIILFSASGTGFAMDDFNAQKKTDKSAAHATLVERNFENIYQSVSMLPTRPLPSRWLGAPAPALDKQDQEITGETCRKFLAIAQKLIRASEKKASTKTSEEWKKRFAGLAC